MEVTNVSLKQHNHQKIIYQHASGRLSVFGVCAVWGAHCFKPTLPPLRLQELYMPCKVCQR